MTLFLGAPTTYTPPPTTVTPPTRRLTTPLRHTWIGWDGSEWDLTGRRPTGVFLRPGVRGLNAPPVQPYLTQLAAVNGSRARGHRIGSRDVFWPLSVWAGGDSQEWLDYDAAFWRTLQPGLTGVWRVEQPNGTVRSLRCTFADDGDHAMPWDPAQRGWAQYGVRLRADQPLWEGPAVEPPAWSAGTQQDFYGGAAGGGFGPPYFISSAFTLATAVMDNPGEVTAWPEWKIKAVPDEVTAVAVGVAGRLVEVPFIITQGYQLVIDTHPTAQTALYGPIPAVGAPFVGVDRTRDLGAAEFAPIPKGQSRPLSLSMTGAGTVQARLVPLHHRAW